VTVQPFSDPIAGGGILVQPEIRSPNFVTGASGWIVRVDGSAEFNDLILHGGAIIVTSDLLQFIFPLSNGITLIAPSGDTTGATDASNINTALSVPGGTVVLMPGTFTINATLTPGASFGQILAGCGWATQIHYDGITVVPAIGPASAGARLRIRDLRLTQTNATSAGTAIDLSGTTDSQVENVLIDGSTAAPNRGIVLNSGSTHYDVIRDCRINVAGTGCIGIDINSAANSVTVQDCRILGDANMTGINVNANGITIIRPDIESTGLVGIAFGAGALNCNLIGGYLQNLTTAITLASGSGPITITGADLDGSGAGITDSGCLLYSLDGVRDFNGTLLNQVRVGSGTANYFAAQDPTGALVFQISSAGNVFHRKPCFFSTNVAIGGVSSDFGGGGSVLLMEHTTDPGTNPAAGHILLYADAAGNLQARTSAGNVRLIAAV
jgi:hypothetical protein